MTLKFQIEGMGCPRCSARVEQVTKKLAGVASAVVSLEQGTMVCEADSREIASAILAAVTKCGYEIRLCESRAQENV